VLPSGLLLEPRLVRLSSLVPKLAELSLVPLPSEPLVPLSLPPLPEPLVPPSEALVLSPEPLVPRRWDSWVAR